MIVRYYSRTGNNRLAAEYLAERLGREAREIAEAGRTGDRDGLVRAIFGTMFGRRPPIEAMPDEDRNAEVMVLCAPVWATQLPGAVKTYLDDLSSYRSELEELAERLSGS